MRRILLVGLIAAVAIGVGTPADAVTTSCKAPMSVSGPTAVGYDLTADGARICVREDATTRYEINGSAVTYTYGAGGGMAGSVGGLCWYEGSTYTCASAGAAVGALTSLTSGDAVSVFLVPSVCEHHSSYVFAHCFGVFLLGGADGPLGPTMGAGGGVFVCEDAGLQFECPVAEWVWVPLSWGFGGSGR